MRNTIVLRLIDLVVAKCVMEKVISNMEKKINIAELLKNCPKGMELDCILFSNPVKYGGLDNDDCSITIYTETGTCFYLTKEGYLYNAPNSKCIIFPKGKTTWEGFQRPFKDGDIVTCKDRGSLVAFIYKERKDVAIVKHHFALYTGSLGIVTTGEISLIESKIVFATEKEKQKLFQAIKANGYKWNPVTKTLEKLPKFKVGDVIVDIYKKHLHCDSGSGKISQITDDKYIFTDGSYIHIQNQDNWELAPNKFDITTLKAFESKVLVRGDIYNLWEPAIFGFIKDKIFYILGGAAYKQCIPYKNNEHLLGTTNDCDEFYKTWGK